MEFQSRSGFSGCRDPTRKAGTFPVTTSFNPVLGFLGVATQDEQRTTVTPTSFNPVLGFLGVATGQCADVDSHPDGFNPVLGFLGVATH